MNKIEPNFNDSKTLEKYSSAFTLSDMEIFIFPELFYPLVISNIMSPIIWQWRDDPWFKDIHKKTFTYKINRVKQFIMDHFVFNLDLETWGLTNKEQEISRFKNFFDIDVLQQSNALFGYEGDKYYFDMDIRKHFGLDKYTTDTIPYWKTETVEAMNAFQYKEGFKNGAGECVSLSALYAATLFVVGRVPLEKIFLIATPLHSQNFINVNEGVITNNRRIVTKKMWFNGTLMSASARRAIENENITIVAHISGFIHTLYPEATIHPLAYKIFTSSLQQYLKTELTPEIFINYLRYEMNFKQCFQYKHHLNGKDKYIALEKIFAYEHLSQINFTETTRDAFMDEIDPDEYCLSPIEGRICICDIEDFINNNKNLTIDEIKEHFLAFAIESKCKNHENIELIFDGLKQFINVHPRLPNADKNFASENLLEIHIHQTRQEIVDYIFAQSDYNHIANMVLYTYRQMDKIDWIPFIKAATERNPVSVVAFKGKTIEEVYQLLVAMTNKSIYDEKRLAQPDEVWNFRRGDGVEKALLLANLVVNTLKPKDILLIINRTQVELKIANKLYTFSSAKDFELKEIHLPIKID